MFRLTIIASVFFLLALSMHDPVYAGGRKGAMLGNCVDFKQLAGAGGNPSDPVQVQARALGNQRQTQETAFREYNRVANEYLNLVREVTGAAFNDSFGFLIAIGEAAPSESSGSGSSGGGGGQN